MGKTLLSFGHGYSAQELERHLRPLGWQVIGTSREKDGSLQWPGTDMRPYLDKASHLLISIAPDAQGDPVLRALKGDILARQAQFEWVGYLSTIGVYGDHQGGWLDETTQINPLSKRSKERAVAEAEWMALDLPVHIFRLAGIYGPGRGPFAKIRNGTARRIIKKDQVFSRIHVKDIARVLMASIAKPNPGSIYNVCDGNAAPPEDVLAFAAQLLGMPVPEAEDFDTAEMTPMARSFYGESKRVHNTKIKDELGVELLYPDYQSGLRSLL